MAQPKHQIIPKLSCLDSKVIDILKARQPVILTNTGLVDHISQTWTLDYLLKNIPSSTKFCVKSNSLPQILYSDDGKNKGGYSFKNAVKTEFLSFGQFSQKFKESSPGNYVYLQQELKEEIGPHIIRDFQKCKINWLNELKQYVGQGQLTTNVLFIGKGGVITPCHYDEQYNFFTQLHGRKKFIVFSPKDFGYLYPYPVSHAADRQAQVDIVAPNLVDFPKFPSAIAYEGVLEKNEVLYLPEYWWHYVESLQDDLDSTTISLSFWFKPTHTIQSCLLSKPVTDPALIMVVRRNLELFAADSFGAQNAKALFKAIDQGVLLNTTQKQNKQKLLEFIELFLDTGSERFLVDSISGRFAKLS